MTSEERDLITGLFNRLHTADTNNQTPKDQEASQLIGQLTGQQPSAPYLLVQTLLVQEHALSNATTRIKQLEQQVQQAQQTAQKPASGGFLSGLFGHSTPPAPSQPAGVQQGQMPTSQPTQSASAGYAPQGNPPPFPTTANMAPGAGGGFLKGALGTAAGVAGGALLFEGVQNLLGHNAGPFGGFGGFGGGGGRGFLGGGGEVIENNEVVNNYYDNGPGQGGAADTDFQTGQGDLQSDNDTDFQTGQGDLQSDNSAMDNNYDADNTDAGGGDLFSGGDDNSSGGNDDGLV